VPLEVWVLHQKAQEEEGGKSSVKRRLLSARDFGQSLHPPKARSTIVRLCQQGRILGAMKPGREWLIPQGAAIKGARTRIEYGRHKGLSPSQYAKKHGVHRSRIYQLLKQDRIEGAKQTAHGWDIPKSAPYPSEDGF
jgi:hypothetical protein